MDGFNVERTAKGIIGGGCLVFIINAIISIVLLGLLIWGLIWGVQTICNVGLKNVVEGLWYGNTNVVTTVVINE